MPRSGATSSTSRIERLESKVNTDNRMIVVEGVDGSGKSLQCRRLHRSFASAGEDVILTREPGGSPAAEQIRRLLVEGEPEYWDDMTELLLMYAARRAHLRDTVWPALAAGRWVISDRHADSSRAFQGIAGELGLDTVEHLHQLVLGEFAPALVLVLDLPEGVALERARQRGDHEDRFEKKGAEYHARVRAAFRQLARENDDRYVLIDAEQDRDAVSRAVTAAVNDRFALNLTPDRGD